MHPLADHPADRPAQTRQTARARNVHLPSHPRVAHPLLTMQHDPSPHSHRLARLRTSRNQAQFPAILLAYLQSFRGTPGTEVCCPPQTYATDFSLRTLTERPDIVPNGLPKKLLRDNFIF